MRLAPGTRWSFRSFSPRSCCSATPPLSSPTYLITQNKTVSVVTNSYYLVDFTAGSADASECTVKPRFPLVKDRNWFWLV